ncbi:tetraacyldisaccharide 4'-kinase [Nafulsella turpanensis]|uniref:tetraacyldisaccharide 4'-kinase n=1 Tax=Nafulsella turpanensis TaxID=1265690 RepID=UPI00034AFED9|nr:tetraacyldisaccharide 4'-kinase [Nafulsella turpanensis]
MKIQQTLLYPFSIVYDGITRLRNHLYELEMKKSVAFTPVLINVGNLSVGGTGKTPMVEYLIRLLQQDYRLATLSRGYGRRTRGFRLAGPEESAKTLGDEPYQLYQAWKDKIVVAVGEERTAAIPEILYAHPEVELILLDDAFQHRAVKADFNILLTTWQRPFFDDYVLPAGRLREARKGAARAEAIVVTKCPPSVDEKKLEAYRTSIARYAGAGKPVFFSTLAYDAPQPFKGEPLAAPEKVVLVSGLANASLLEEEVKGRFQLLKHFPYPDHYNYKKEDLQQVVDFARQQEGAVLLTTTKDAAKWQDPVLSQLLERVPVYTLPVRHRFLAGEEAFRLLLSKTIVEKMKV